MALRLTKSTTDRTIFSSRLRIYLILLAIVTVLPSFPPTVSALTSSCCSPYRYTCLTRLEAKKSKKRDGGGRGRKRKSAEQEEPNSTRAKSRSKNKVKSGENASQQVPQQFQVKPTSTKKSMVRIARPGNLAPVDVCVVEINDADWWEAPENINPFGARLWPPSLAIAQFLAGHLSSIDDDNRDGNDERAEGTEYGAEEKTLEHGAQTHPQKRRHVIEVGCGTGLISLTAAECGAQVLATDISPDALRLTRAGWSEMCKRNHARSIAAATQTATDSNEKGVLDTASFDLFASSSLPLSRQKNDDPPIVVASAVFYDRRLGKAVARHVFEACRQGAWVILGDDDTGLRDGGREVFESELERLQSESAKDEERLRYKIVHTTIKQKVFGWTEKPVRILHFNAPTGVDLG